MTQTELDPTDQAAVEFAEVAMLTLCTDAIAVALHVGGLPRDWRSLTHRALADVALAGIRRIGIEEVLRLKNETTRLRDVLARAKPDADVSWERTQFRRIWSSLKGRQEAVDAAYTVMRPGSYGRSFAA
jgi:hypothetical protein